MENVGLCQVGRKLPLLKNANLERLFDKELFSFKKLNA